MYWVTHGVDPITFTNLYSDYLDCIIMRIETDIKLDYNDVLLRPKRSTMGSRKDVDLLRTYKFRNRQREWTGIHNGG